MPTALVIQHAAVEGVGRFADWLPAAGVDLRILRPYDGEPLPSTIDADALIVMGGPMGANDDADVPWLAATKHLLAESVRRRVPALGVCLGAQLLAVATGGAVERGEAGPELGLDAVEIAVADALLDAGSMAVVQWHYDTVTRLPPEATLLGSSRRYATQAFRVGDLAWGVQFHVEATPGMVADWARAERIDEAAVVDPVVDAQDRLTAVGERVARRFAAVVAA
ncbi:MAG TPA: type 1 glutamine amidotransferase [Mycobacteriales bacterium]|nr:type 1 glutamine amidotransferase [Mycobacteriales bacterium]